MPLGGLLASQAVAQQQVVFPFAGVTHVGTTVRWTVGVDFPLSAIQLDVVGPPPQVGEAKFSFQQSYAPGSILQVSTSGLAAGAYNWSVSLVPLVDSSFAASSP